MSWSDRYIGIPFQDHGRTASGCDCWGLVCLVHAQERGQSLPVYDGYTSAHEATEVAALMAGAEVSPLWARVETPQPFDLAVFRRGRLARHVGVVVRPGLMLHMAPGGAVIERLDRGSWAQRLCGIWRYAGGVQ